MSILLAALVAGVCGGEKGLEDFCLEENFEVPSSARIVALVVIELRTVLEPGACFEEDEGGALPL